MLLARQYNLFPGLSDLSGLDLLLTDHTILNRVISEENEAIRKQHENSDRERRLPGVTRMVSASERSEQLREMRMGD